MKKFVIVSDIHGNHADLYATAAALAFTKDFNPEIRIIAGDLWDFSAIRKGASEEDRAVSMRDDFEVGAKFADSFFKALFCLQAAGIFDTRDLSVIVCFRIPC